MKKIATVAAALASIGILGTAHAEEPIQIAALGDLSGKVMVYNGDNYAIAETGMPLELGSQVVTLEGATANVAFDKGCIASLEENSVLAIENVDMCAQTAQAGEPVMVAQAIGATRTDAVPAAAGGAPAGAGAAGGASGLAAIGPVAGSFMGVGLIAAVGAANSASLSSGGASAPISAQ